MWSSSIRRTLLQGLTVASALASAYMSYTALGMLTNCKSPVFVVLSGSMEPGIYRGDLLFLTNWEPRLYSTGDITIYEVPGASGAIPIVHRVLQTHDSRRADGGYERQDILTKGDNNDLDDVSLYNGVERLQPEHVVGKVRCIIPWVGYASIFMNESQRQKYAVFGIVGLFSLL